MRRLWMLAMVPLLLTMGCGSKERSEQSKKAESLLEQAYKARNYQQLITRADSLEAKGALPTARADYWRGYASDRMNRKRMAEFYWKASLKGAANSNSSDGMDIYAKSASRLANLLTVRGDYESVLKSAIPVAERLEEMKCDTTSDYINLLIYIGCCQAGIGEAGNATIDGFDRAYQKHLDNIAKHHSDAAYKDAIAGLINIAYACITIGNYKEALTWTDNFGKLLGEYEQRPGDNGDYIDKQLARFNVYKAIALEGLGQKEEGAKVYEAFLSTQFSKTPEGRINANDYLTAANRWDEAADNYSSLDALLGKKDADYSIEDIQNLLLKKYHTNLQAGRRDSAVAVSLQISNALDKAFEQSKKINEEEQATIVQKVEQMTEQQAEEARHRDYLLVAALIGVLLCFVGYILYRRHGGHQLKAAYKDLEKDYALLEERVTSKVGTETERRIARDIRERMTPQAPPPYKGLDLDATLIPGQSTCSDLYDSVIRNEKLFFCLGNAIEGDIQSSVLASTVWSLFRTAAALEEAPEQIVSTINAAIAKEGTTIPGITLFVGVLDLNTWQLAYCNAGHHAPLLLLGDQVGQVDAESNKPVGLDRSFNYVPQTMTIEKGTMVFLYSSGLLKVKNAEGKAYGEKKMRGAALQGMKMHQTPKHFIEGMLEALKNYSGDTPQDDDITMMVIQR